MNKKFSTTTPNSHLFLEEDMRLFEFPQVFGASAIWHKNKMENKIATYDLFVRDLPKNRNFMLLGGVEEIIKGILNWKYSDDEIDFLINEKIITDGFANYLRNFKFTGHVYAMREGTAFFPNEPVIRVTALIIEGNLITLFLINSITSNTIFFTKFIRSIIAAKGKAVIGPGGIRAQGFDSAMKACRAAHLCGTSIILPSFYRKYNMKMPSVITIGYHAYIKSFPAEIDAMRSISETFPHRAISLMIDTYEIDAGLKNAITVIKELKRKNEPLPNIFIDSGDLFELAKMARRELENAGLDAVKIAIASNLDEFRIDEYIKRGIPADSFVVCTEGITSSDDPKLETVYKMAELRYRTTINNLAKLTKGKASLPGRKNVFRIYENGKMARDIIGEENENLGEPLLIKMIENGELIYDLPEMDEIRSYIKEQVKKLPEPLLEIDKQNKYDVMVSKKLEELLEEVKREHLNK
ncbi:MAG: nicotinate phosphoribosyltransferase [bacterium]